jgi:hypothetical protein
LQAQPHRPVVAPTCWCVRVEYSSIAYTAGPPTTDHGPGLEHTNGLSLHAVDNWIIRGYRFKDLQMPDSYRWLWNPAMLVWDHSSNTVAERNVFISVDRVIAYGLQDTSSSDHQGVVRSVTTSSTYSRP